MKRVSVLEYGRLWRGKHDEPTGHYDGNKVFLSEKHFERLRSFDERQAPTTSKQIFSWRRNSVKARQWVGVVQVHGLTVEILPKTEQSSASSGEEDETSEQTKQARFARRNLLYMLSVAGDLPLRERDIASQSVVNAPLVETLITVFARRLRDELLRGRHRNYVRLQGNLPVLKGKLLFSQHIKHNAARQDRFFVEYDEFLPDTWLNRIFKAACRELHAISSTPSTQETLGHCLMMLDRVTDVPVNGHDFDRVFVTRQNERFEEVFNFCRLILTGQSPAGSAGKTRSFTLLFNMHALFESFMTEFIRRYVLTHEAFEHPTVYPQGKKKTRYLVYRPSDPAKRDSDGYDPYDEDGHMQLKPDILIGRGGDRPPIIIDTKWKRLKASRSARQGVGRNDLYQMFGYAHSYEAHHNVLLYPKPPDEVDSVAFDIPQRIGSSTDEEGRYAKIEVHFARLDRDLKGEREDLVRELQKILAPMFGVSSSIFDSKDKEPNNKPDHSTSTSPASA
jgi:5-methylcytosine-specific restriction enzyme subunit McrC